MSLLDKDVPNFRVIIISGQRVRDIKGEHDLNIPVTFYWTIIQKHNRSEHAKFMFDNG